MDSALIIDEQTGAIKPSHYNFLSNVNLPLVKEINYTSPYELFAKIADHPWSIFFDSADHEKYCQPTNRYSYIAYKPFQTFTLKNGMLNGSPIFHSNDPFLPLQQWLKKYSVCRIPTLPPFQGGLAGYFGYDICHYLENIPLVFNDDFQFPDFAVALYDAVISFDHHLKKTWIIITGFAEPNEKNRFQYAKRKLVKMLKLFHAIKPMTTKVGHPFFIKQNFSPKIYSNFCKESYINLVNKARDYILAGDIFQVNLAQRFIAKLFPFPAPWALYQQLRNINPAPFAAFLNLDCAIIISASIERFISLRENAIETRPIKGTIKRGNNLKEDKTFATQLLNSKKNWAENVMIVDLLRNDLSRVSLDDSVRVEKLCNLESYPTVHHLVSVIRSELKPGLNAIDILRATFPGGSVTGAPKIRAMQIISELEPHRRGPYCGCIGFISFSGDMDTSIVIRTYAIRSNTITYHAGGAIVLNSEAEAEYQETLQKAQALTRALHNI